MSELPTDISKGSKSEAYNKDEPSVVFKKLQHKENEKEKAPPFVNPIDITDCHGNTNMDANRQTPQKRFTNVEQKTPSKSFRRSQSKTPRKSFQQKSPAKSTQKTPKKSVTPSKGKSSAHANKRLIGAEVSTEDQTPTKRPRTNISNKNENNKESECLDANEATVDESLEKKARKINMTAKNVKSVIHHVLTNELVLNMFKNVLRSEEDETGPQVEENTSQSFIPENLDCVPKMTRAKVKHILEKICAQSPMKITKGGPSILDVEFAEEEDDDEYNPEKDEECHDSDDDESVTSSRMSDFGSPYPNTPSTPVIRQSDLYNMSSTPIQYPSCSFTNSGTPKNLAAAFSASSSTPSELEQEGVDTIALRTRSKLPLTSTTITEIESAFVAPDITPDLYHTNYEDPEYYQFLSNLYKPADETITDDDADANDPEFNYFAEAEREKPDAEDFRVDKFTQIPKKELLHLLDGLEELFEDEVLPHQAMASASEMNVNTIGEASMQDSIQASQMSQPASNACNLVAEFKTPSAPPCLDPVQEFKTPNAPSSLSYIQAQSYEESPGSTNNYLDPPAQVNVINYNSFTEMPYEEVAVSHEHRALIEDNMRKHIQLLAQSYILFHGKNLESSLDSVPMELLNELKNLREQSPAGQKSVFNVCNLNPALELLENSSLFEDANTDIHISTNKNACGLTNTQQLAIFNSPAFVYPFLLPSLKKNVKTDRKYNKFLQSEDNLIALGLEQFQHCKNILPVQLIQNLLIRGKDSNKIHFRIQFMSSQKVGDNAIKCVKKTGKLPDNFPKPVVDTFYPQPPRDQFSVHLPGWCLALRDKMNKSSVTNATLQPSVSSEAGQAVIVAKQPIAVLEQNKFSSSLQKTASTSKRGRTKNKLKSITPQAMQQTDSRIPGLSTFILPSSMAPVSGIFIQFGNSAKPLPFISPSVPGTPVHSAPGLSTAETASKSRITTETISSDSACSNPGNWKSYSNTVATQTLEPSSPDILAKSMLSCGIAESPICPSPSNAVNPSMEPCSTSTPTPSSSCLKNNIVRNLNSAFDAANNSPAVSVRSPALSIINHSEASSQTLSEQPIPKDNANRNKSSETDMEVTLTSENVNTSQSGLTQEVTSDTDTMLVVDTSCDMASQESVSNNVVTDKKSTSSSVQLDNNTPVLPVETNFNTESRVIVDVCLQEPGTSSNVLTNKECTVVSDEEVNSGGHSNPVSDQEASPEKKKTIRTPSPKKVVSHTPTKLRPLAPKQDTPNKTSTPYVPLPKISPRRLELNKQVRQILPKSFIFEPKSPSPTKAAALMLKRKAAMVCQRQSPIKILPKQLPSAESPSKTRSRVILTPSRMYTRSQHTKTKNAVEKSSQDESKYKKQDETQGKDVSDSGASEKEESGLSQEEEEEEDDVFGEENQLDDLMAACTTIRYDPKKGSNQDTDTKSKAQKKRDISLAMLDADILECDPKKDERDTEYAQYYFNRVKDKLKDDPGRFRKFLTLLHDLNKDHGNPIELYADLATLLSDHRELVDDFAGFLLSFQAVECQCFVSSMEYQQIRSFLRRLEIYCGTSNQMYQRTLKMMSKWLNLNQDAQTDPTPFKDRIGAVLRHVPGVMDDLFSYFFDGPFYDSCYPEDFETVELDEDDDIDELDKFEEVVLPEGREDYNTKLCQCRCHEDTQDEKLLKRSRHCVSCSLKMIDGRPVLKTTHHDYFDVSIIYPLEEKEKLAKAKKEAAQLALAKARAQRQLKKKNKKKRDLAKLKSKSGRKENRKKPCKLEDLSSDAGVSDSADGAVLSDVNTVTEPMDQNSSNPAPPLTKENLSQGSPDLKMSARRISLKSVAETGCSQTKSCVAGTDGFDDSPFLHTCIEKEGEVCVTSRTLFTAAPSAGVRAKPVSSTQLLSDSQSNAGNSPAQGNLKTSSSSLSTQGNLKTVASSSNLSSQGNLKTVASSSSLSSQGNLKTVASSSSLMPQGNLKTVASSSSLMPQGNLKTVASSSSLLPQGNLKTVASSSSLSTQGNLKTVASSSNLSTQGNLKTVASSSSLSTQGNLKTVASSSNLSTQGNLKTVASSSSLSTQGNLKTVASSSRLLPQGNLKTVALSNSLMPQSNLKTVALSNSHLSHGTTTPATSSTLLSGARAEVPSPATPSVCVPPDRETPEPAPPSPVTPTVSEPSQPPVKKRKPDKPKKKEQVSKRSQPSENMNIELQKTSHLGVKQSTPTPLLTHSQLALTSSTAKPNETKKKSKSKNSLDFSSDLLATQSGSVQRASTQDKTISNTPLYSSQLPNLPQPTSVQQPQIISSPRSVKRREKNKKPPKSEMITANATTSKPVSLTKSKQTKPAQNTVPSQTSSPLYIQPSFHNTRAAPTSINPTRFSIPSALSPHSMQLTPRTMSFQPNTPQIVGMRVPVMIMLEPQVTLSEPDKPKVETKKRTRKPRETKSTSSRSRARNDSQKKSVESSLDKNQKNSVISTEPTHSVSFSAGVTYVTNSTCPNPLLNSSQNLQGFTTQPIFTTSSQQLAGLSGYVETTSSQQLAGLSNFVPTTSSQQLAGLSNFVPTTSSQQLAGLSGYVATTSSQQLAGLSNFVPTTSSQQLAGLSGYVATTSSQQLAGLSNFVPTTSSQQLAGLSGYVATTSSQQLAGLSNFVPTTSSQQLAGLSNFVPTTSSQQLAGLSNFVPTTSSQQLAGLSDFVPTSSSQQLAGLSDPVPVVTLTCASPPPNPDNSFVPSNINHELHTSDTCSLFHFSPAKFKGSKVPDIVRAHLENLSFGGFDESLDFTAHSLAHAISPNKLGDTMSRFDLLAYLESVSQFNKDTGMSTVTTSSGESRLSFSGVLAEVNKGKVEENRPSASEAITSPAAGGVSQSSALQTLRQKDMQSGTGAHHRAQPTTQGYESTAQASALCVDRVEFQRHNSEESLAMEGDLDWTEHCDRTILNVVTVEGITSESVNKIHLLLPDRSVDEITSRAELLLNMLQEMSESDAGTEASSCDESRN
ncbi:GON-4-like protein [Physella acuta]|uniref:GON-4-like protein n=1 Tax=Physella acuta TaxID=109671 RepID=UPI0027DD56B1|nr:GON-4-like protein [Physella acuta]